MITLATATTAGKGQQILVQSHKEESQQRWKEGGESRFILEIWKKIANKHWRMPSRKMMFKELLRQFMKHKLMTTLMLILNMARKFLRSSHLDEPPFFSLYEILI